jgi:hypothetical protein
VLTSVRKIGAVTFLAAVTTGIATLTRMVVIIIALAIDAHRAGVGILIVSIIYSISPIDITLNLNGAVALLSALSNRVSDLVGNGCTCCTHGTGTSQTSVDDRVFCKSPRRSNFGSLCQCDLFDALQSRSERTPLSSVVYIRVPNVRLPSISCICYTRETGMSRISVDVLVSCTACNTLSIPNFRLPCVLDPQ